MIKLASLSRDELNAAFEASIESMKQDSYKKLLKVHEISVARRDHENEISIMPWKYEMRKVPSSTLAEFREGLGSRIGISLLPCRLLLHLHFENRLLSAAQVPRTPISRRPWLRSTAF